MKYTTFVCLFASTLVVNSAAQVQTPSMRQGISVHMANTANASPMPEADKENAWVVAVTADGRIFFGTKPVTDDGLAQIMQETPRHRDQDLYIKSDERASFGDLKPVLKAAIGVWFQSAVLLTNQDEATALGKLVAPKGLTVILAPSSSRVTVQLRTSDEKLPRLAVNGQEISASDLQTALNQALQGQPDRVVRLQVDDNISFAKVAFVIDECSSVNAHVAIPME